MIRILLSIAVAAAAYFGPWLQDSSNQVLNEGVDHIAYGSGFVEATADCAMDGKFSLDGECAPEHGVLGQLMAVTIALAAFSAAVSVIGLVPLVGRLTSLVTIVAGFAAIVTFAWFAKELITIEGALLSNFRWGAYATGIFGVLTVFAGLAGLRGDDNN